MYTTKEVSEILSSGSNQILLTKGSHINVLFTEGSRVQVLFTKGSYICIVFKR